MEAGKTAINMDLNDVAILVGEALREFNSHLENNGISLNIIEMDTPTRVECDAYKLTMTLSPNQKLSSH